MLVAVVATSGSAEPQVVQAADGARPATTSQEMAQMHEAARERKRRVIYNRDGGTIFGKLKSPEDCLSKHIIPALNTQVDAIFYCTMVTTLYSHDTNVGERMDDLADALGSTSEHSINARHNMRMLRKAGKDILALVVDKGHEAGLEVFWSHRINDLHDSEPGWTDILSQWKREHPEFLMGTPEDTERYPSSSPRYYWSSLDFGKPQVRQYLLRITEDVARRYDVDGIEIDYLKSPMFFRPNLDGKPATQEQLDILTEFQREMRRIVQEAENERGRPMLIGARVPMSAASCRNVGIDIERWLREGLLDLMSVGNGDAWPNLPAAELVKLGHKHNVPVYPCLKYGGFGPGVNTPSASPDIEPWRAGASNAWRIGADGIYLFNMFPSTPQHPMFMQLGDPEKLATLDKLFAATDTAPYSDRMLIRPHEKVCGLSVVLPRSMALPATLAPGAEPRIVTLQIGDDIAGASDRGKLAGAVLKVRVSGPEVMDRVEIRLNGQHLDPTGAEPEEGRLTFNPKPAWYRVGDNEVSVRLTAALDDGAGPPQVLTVQVDVRYTD
jgi:hypothetical protein